MEQMTYEQANAYIADVPKFTKKNEASNTLELLRRLGDPQEKLQIVHVAGTNGKGSVCAFLAGMLEAGGYRTGLFISPHLVRINERFQINRQEVSDEAFTDAFAQVKQAIDSMVADGFFHPTYFEILFAIGMILFEQARVDYLVMETGLGGRLDATNTVAHPKLCVITSISLDHTEYLGDTIPQIAWEKAGIIKEGVPVVYDGRNREAEEVIRRVAKERHAKAIPFYSQMAQITGSTDKSIAFVLNNRYYDYISVEVPFLAPYQVMNCSLALTAMRVLDTEKRIPDAALVEAVGRTSWSGRMEVVMPGVVIDGAHNEDGILEFLRTVRLVAKERPVSLLFAAVVEKNYEKMIREICADAPFAHVVVTQIEGSRKVPSEEFAALFRRYTNAPVYARENVREAFALACSLKGEGMLFCAGSLYLVGEIRALLEGEKGVQAH